MKTEIGKCLVIVDLQTRFGISNDCAVVEAVQDRIRRAEINGDYIVVLEWPGNGKIVDAIVNVLPDNAVFLKKHCNSGERVISAHLEDQDIEITDEFIMTGINLPWCVGQTAIDLAESNPDLNVVIDVEACDDYSESRDSKEKSINIFLRENHNSELVDIVLAGEQIKEMV